LPKKPRLPPLQQLKPAAPGGSGPYDAPVPPDLVVMAHVKEPYGLKGWIKLYTHSEEASGLARFGVWWIAATTDGKPGSGAVGKSGNAVRNWRRVVPEQTGEHSGVLIAKLPGVNDRDAAFALKSFEIAVPRSEFAARGENEYYWAELIGLDVVNRQGELLGNVTELMDLGPHQVLQVGRAGAEAGVKAETRLIPFVEQYVDSVDLAQKVIRVDWGTDF
jgi:16S rRNA processing protein RimM